MLSSTV